MGQIPGKNLKRITAGKMREPARSAGGGRAEQNHLPMLKACGTGEVKKFQLKRI